MRARVAVFALLFSAMLAGASSGASEGDTSRKAASVPAWASALARDVGRLETLGVRDEVRAERRPELRTQALGVPADGRTDATAALQAALDSLPTGGTLVIEPGVYLQTDCLVVRRDGVSVVGRSARLHAIAERMCLLVDGNDVEIRGLEFTAVTLPRGDDPENSRIVLRGRGGRIVENRIIGAATVGIFVQGARDFAIIDNHVSATRADGIHITGGASAGLVARNSTERTGDDGIAVVSYSDSPRCARILIESNRVFDVKSARGLAVIGGNDIIIRGNVVDGTGRAAGILIAREQFWNTHGVDRVIVADNAVSRVARRFGLPAAAQTWQASIDLNGDSARPELRVSQVLVSGNTLRDGATDGIRLLGAVCEAGVVNNRIGEMGGQAIAVVDPLCGVPFASCSGNEVDDPETLPPACRPNARRTITQ